jgi:hypothetical protein
MGWTGYPGKSRDEALKAHLSDLQIIKRTPFIRSGPYEGHVWLLVRGYTSGEPIILQVIVDRNYFKDVDESMGPLSYDVPVSWLDEAPEAPGPFAKAWREKVYAHWGEATYAKRIREEAGDEAAELATEFLDENPDVAF